MNQRALYKFDLDEPLRQYAVVVPRKRKALSPKKCFLC